MLERERAVAPDVPELGVHKISPDRAAFGFYLPDDARLVHVEPHELAGRIAEREETWVLQPQPRDAPPPIATCRAIDTTGPRVLSTAAFGGAEEVASMLWQCQG